MYTDAFCLALGLITWSLWLKADEKETIIGVQQQDNAKMF